MKIVKKILKMGRDNPTATHRSNGGYNYFFKDTIKEKVIAIANENLKATILPQDVDISLFKNFPRHRLHSLDFVLMNKEPLWGYFLLLNI